MKSKKAVYFLAAIVLAVWGLILYKVFLAMQDKDSRKITISTKVQAKLSVPYQYSDTFTLLLKYPDPFTGQVQTPPDTTVKNKEKTVSIAAMAKVPNPLDSLKYLGFVAGGSSNRRVAVLSYKGVESLLKEGEMLHSMKILNIENNAVRVSNGRTIKVLKKE